MRKLKWTAPRIAGLAVIFLPFLAYLVSSLYGSDTYGNILSPLNSLIVGTLMAIAYIKSDRSVHMSVSLPVYMLASVAWAAADINWAVQEAMGMDPSVSVFGNIMYIVPNVLYLLIVIMFLVATLKKWNRIQALVDTVIIVILTVFLLWSVFFQKNAASMLRFVEGDIISAVSIISDIIITLGILMYFLSLRTGKLPVFVRIMFFGLLTYAITDLVYFYFDFRGLYDPNSVIDFAYICSFELLAVGIVWKGITRENVHGIREVENSGRRILWVYLLAYPLISVLFGDAKIADLLFYAIMIFFYSFSSSFFQVSLEKEQLLLREKNMNELLETRVQEQVREMTFLANQDTLTSLLNRRSFISSLEESIATLRQGETMAVMVLDLDRFKNINDSYGHDVGDLVLVEISERLVGWNRWSATLARLGGDEFAVVMVGRYSRADIRDICSQIVDCCGRPYRYASEEVRLTVSLGAARYSQSAVTGAELMKNADTAMYRAKGQGYNRFLLFEDLPDDKVDRRSEIEKLLRKADFTRDFEIFYQPQYSLGTNKLIGAEALLRWKTAEHGYIPPNEFIPVAEEIGCISEIGSWVMTRTILQSIDWNSQFGLELKLGFNVSPKQFDDDSLIEVMTNVARLPGFTPEWIDAEITENIMIKDDQRIRKAFELFGSLGISVSIDDFGSGYASFGNLNRYRFGRIKIDKTLIDQVSPENFSGIQVVKAIVTMADAIGVKTIAEGIETMEQYDILEMLGCDEAQGYLLGRPVPAEVFEEMFIRNPKMVKEPARA